MPTISGIAPQKKRSDRYSIFVDGEYSFSLGDMELAASGLKYGQEISLAEVQGWQHRSELGKALGRAYNFLSYRPRTTKEIKDYLGRKDYPESVAEEVVEKLQEQKYLDDEQFARDWIAERQATNPKSALALRHELMKKGIGGEIIELAMSEFSVGESSGIIKLIETKRLLQRYNDEAKLIRYLAGQGFKYDQIKRALAELNS
jgi:regulatory protein